MKQNIVYLLMIIMLIMTLTNCSTTKPIDTITVDIIIDTINDMPVQGANVSLQHNITSQIYSIENITSSRVTFVEIPEGTYTLTVSLEGYHTYTAYPLSILSSMEVLVTLITDNLAMVTFDISTSDGGAVTGAVVSLEHSTEDIVYGGTLSGNAHIISFSPVAFGVYTLTVSLAGYQTYVTDLSIQSPIDVSVVLIPISTTANVYIEIGSSDNGSIMGAVVSLVRNSTGASYTETVTEDINSVMFSGVVFGVYTLNVTHESYYPFENTMLSVNSADVYSTAFIFSITGVVLPSEYAWVSDNEAWLFTLDNIYLKYLRSVSGNNWIPDNSMTGAIYHIEGNQLFIVREGMFIAKMTFFVTNGILIVNIYEQTSGAVPMLKVFEIEWVGGS